MGSFVSGFYWRLWGLLCRCMQWEHFASIFFFFGSGCFVISTTILVISWVLGGYCLVGSLNARIFWFVPLNSGFEIPLHIIDEYM